MKKANITQNLCKQTVLNAEKVVFTVLSNIVLPPNDIKVLLVFNQNRNSCRNEWKKTMPFVFVTS